MAIIKPFKGLRPPKEIVEYLASVPYDVINSSEAFQIAENNEFSFLHITRAEIDFFEDIDIHSEIIYKKALENFNKFQQKGWLKQDENPSFYIYALTMNSKTQYGLVGAAACEDYFSGKIKKHELTRPEKEDDRMNLMRYLNANIEPVFFSYKAVPEIDKIIMDYTSIKKPEFDFIADDGVLHQLWKVDNKEKNLKIEKLFAEKVPYTYVADGHHRTAAAARIGIENKEKNPSHNGSEEYNYFMAVHFPDNQLRIFDYNRVLKDLNGLTDEEFLEKLNQGFFIEEKDTELYRPACLHEFSMYLSGKWYKLTAKKDKYQDDDPTGALDVDILFNQVLGPILNIDDLRTSDRIDFIGGIRGLEELRARVDNEEMKIAFALYPVSMKQLIDIADSGKIMPPKTTWFEPKLRSGLVIRKLD